MADNQPITNATVTFYTSADVLVGTAALEDLQYVIENLTEGSYYFKVEAPDRGTVIKNLEIPGDESGQEITRTVLMVAGVDVIPVTVLDKDDVNISDATVKIARIEGVYDGTGTKYDVSDVPVGTQQLVVSHSDSTYQTLIKSIYIQDGATFEEILYPVVNGLIKVFVNIGDPNESTDDEDVTTRTSCIMYDVTNSNTLDASTRVLKTGGYFKLANKNNGEFKIHVPSFYTTINGNNYRIGDIDRTIFLDYSNSTGGNHYVNVRTSDFTNLDEPVDADPDPDPIQS